MAYPSEQPSGNYILRDYDFATNDTKKLPMDEYLFKNGYKNADESETESVPDAHNQNWLFDVLHKNLRYTKQVAEENKKQLETKLATPTSIGQIKVGYGLEITSNGVLSVSKKVAEDANIISYDLPVGSYMLWAGSNTPEYFIEPAGQELLRADYPELWEFAQNNDLVGKLFGEGDGSTTFTVTDIRGNFISIANSNDKVGVFTEAGLPNITGSARGGNAGGAGTTSNQALYNNSAGGGRYTGSGSWVDYYTINIDASRSSSVYGKSDTVTPANWGLKLILKALPTPPSNAVPTGTILDYTGTSVPDGYIIANGAELSRSTFSQLYQWVVANNLIVDQELIPDTAHGFYGTGDGTTTFTIPDLRGVFKRCADLISNRGGAEVGEYQPDGLPNITGGTALHSNSSDGNLFGAFYYTRTAVSGFSQFPGNGRSYATQGVGINASLSNSIYGNSNSVQPKSVSILPILKY